MTEDQMREIVSSLNQISWRSAEEITPEAEVLINEHLARMRRTIRELKASRGMNANDAYALAQAAGNMAPEYRKFFDLIWSDVKFKGAGTREPMILTIVSSYFWDEDLRLKHLENPWEPLVKLYRLGYTSSFDETEADESLDLVVGFRDTLQAFPLYRPVRE